MVREYHRLYIKGKGPLPSDTIREAFDIGQIWYAYTGKAPPSWQKQAHITHEDILEMLEEIAGMEEVSYDDGHVVYSVVIPTTP